MSRKPTAHIEPEGGWRIPSKEFAYTVWREEGHPSFRQLSDRLAARGYKVAFQVLQRWCSQNSAWKIEADAVGKAPLPGEDTAFKLLGLLEAADREGSANVVKAEHFEAIKAHLVARLYQTVRTLPLGNVDEWNQGLDIITKLDAHAHNLRGKAIGEKPAVNQGNGTGLIERMQPTITVAPFKRTNGKEAH